MKELACLKEMSSENTAVEKRVSPVSDEQRKEDAKERRKQTRREYYLKNRERINAKSKEYYYANTERILAQKREYRAANKVRLSAKNREYRTANKERLSACQREYQAINKERISARYQEYWAANRERLLARKRECCAANRERLLAQKREYYIRNKDRLILKQKEYYQSNKYTLCHNLLNRDVFKRIEQTSRLYSEKVNHYMTSYPFEEYAERYIKGELYRNGICPSHDYYDDCYDAGMLAYLYSIHRCAAMDYIYVVPYIKKLVKIYIICALVVYHEAKNLCQVNGFQQIQLDAADHGRGY